MEQSRWGCWEAEARLERKAGLPSPLSPQPPRPASKQSRAESLTASQSLIGMGCRLQGAQGCQAHIVAAPGDPRFRNITPEGDTVVGKAPALTACPGRAPGQSQRGWPLPHHLGREAFQQPPGPRRVAGLLWASHGPPAWRVREGTPARVPPNPEFRRAPVRGVKAENGGPSGGLPGLHGALSFTAVLIAGEATHQRGAASTAGPQECVFPHVESRLQGWMTGDLNRCLSHHQLWGITRGLH